MEDDAVQDFDFLFHEAKESRLTALAGQAQTMSGAQHNIQVRLDEFCRRNGLDMEFRLKPTGTTVDGYTYNEGEKTLDFQPSKIRIGIKNHGPINRQDFRVGVSFGADDWEYKDLDTLEATPRDVRTQIAEFAADELIAYERAALSLEDFQR